MVLAACVAPAAVVFAAFWLLPMVQLVLLPASKGYATYFVVLTEPRYLQSLVQTTLLSVAVTLVSLALAAAVGLYLGRRSFAGRRLLMSVLTLPLSFPGVIVGFFVILVGGRQGPFASVTDAPERSLSILARIPVDLADVYLADDKVFCDTLDKCRDVSLFLLECAGRWLGDD